MADTKTSISHHLIINDVSIPGGGGKIGLTFCPGKDRDVALDLERTNAFGAKALVTLMEDHELDEVRTPGMALAHHAKENGIEWHHLPIKDVGVPDERFEDLWTYSGLRLRALLARGDNIVVHCHGGLGRTGTIAARLLVEFGETPEAAIRRVREARPKSIETRVQEKYIEHCRPVRCARVIRSPEERAIACLLGGALGDGLGYEIEFNDLNEIRERFGDAGIEEPVLHQGKLVVSDDTQMTLFTLEGLLNSLQHDEEWGAHCTPCIRDAYLDWYTTQNLGKPAPKSGKGWLVQQCEMRVQRAPGNTCMGALNAGGHGSITTPINNSKGCGGVMRTAPIGLIPLADAGTAFRLGAQASALTHGHASGYLSGGMMAALVRVLLDGACLTGTPHSHSGMGAVEQCCGLLQAYRCHEETLGAVEEALQMAANGRKEHAMAIERLGGGWVGEEALAIALYATLAAESFVDAIRIAANHSGDSDSTAAIAGQLWGAAYGLEGMPHVWISSLDVFVPLLHLARQLILRCYP